MSSDFSLTGRKRRGDLAAPLEQLGKYRITRKLGAGGMGTVYLAVDSELNRAVALKVLPRERAENPILVRRFKSEGQAAALLKHPNIVSVYEAGEIDGYLFLALEFVDGIDIAEWMQRRGAISPRRSVHIVRQVAEALQHAYERNIVHRDIKPSNLMISRDGAVRLTDMGLARSIDETLDSKITRDGTTVGTVDYMAPEQASDSRAADIRSDLYSLGCSWYHMLTGRPPYSEGSVTNKLTAHFSAPIPDPRQHNPEIPEALVAVLHRLMAKRKEDRYQSPADLIADLDNAALQRSAGAGDLLSMFGEEVEPDAAAHVIADSGLPNRAPTADSSSSRPVLTRGDFASLRKKNALRHTPPVAESRPRRDRGGRARSSAGSRPVSETPSHGTWSWGLIWGLCLAGVIIIAWLVWELGSSDPRTVPSPYQSDFPAPVTEPESPPGGSSI